MILVFLLAALAGVVLAVLTYLVSLTNIGGEYWSLSGNGALVVAFAGLAACLAGGWVMLSLWRVGHSRWRVIGALAGGIALCIAAFSTFAPVVAISMMQESFLRGDGQPTGIEGIFALRGITIGVPLVLAFAAGLLLARNIGALDRRAVIAAASVLAGAIAIVTAQPGLYFLAGPMLLIPLLLGIPAAVAARPRGARQAVRFHTTWLWLSNIALPIGLFAGLIGAQWILAGI